MRFNFDEFVLDTDARELRRSGAAIHLSPKAFELLQVLVERRPTAISKADLHALLWQDTFVTDTSLATVVSEVRSALQDDPRRPRYIRTVHAFGYAFCGEALACTAGANGQNCWIQQENRTFRLVAGENIIGRAPQSAIVVDLPEVSRRHACIHVSAAGATLEDLSSRNGTFVREERITAAYPLSDGDEIRIGPATLTFHVALGGATTKAVVPAQDQRLKES